MGKTQIQEYKIFPYSCLVFSETASMTSSSLMFFNSAMALMDMRTLAGSLRVFGSGPKTGLSVSTSRHERGMFLTSFCFCRDRTTEGGMEK